MRRTFSEHVALVREETKTGRDKDTGYLLIESVLVGHLPSVCTRFVGNSEGPIAAEHNECIIAELLIKGVAIRNATLEPSFIKPLQAVCTPSHITSGLPVVRPQFANLRHLETTLLKETVPSHYQRSNSLTFALPRQFMRRSLARSREL
jgi:hypothetical protein